ncbi:MAG: RecX family transcriptional regulator [Culturomica sp.]|jgi:regulatory protein|nr:RecX family transcriptional regulator [Culturomica sp.]
MEAKDPKKAQALAAAACSKKECCAKDIRTKLEKWGVDGRETEQILDWLFRNNFLNHTRFANAFACDKFRFGKWGKQKIAQALRQREVPEEAIREALSGLVEEAYDDTCIYLLKKKRESLRNPDNPLNSPGIQARLIRFALSRGFDYDTIRRCLRKLADT